MSEAQETYKGLPPFGFIAIALLAWAAFGDSPMWYYSLLRLAITGIAVMFAVAASERGRRKLMIVYGFLAFAFNPFFPIYMDRDAWQVLDVVAAALFVFGVWRLTRPAQAKALPEPIAR